MFNHDIQLGICTYHAASEYEGFVVFVDEVLDQFQRNFYAFLPSSDLPMVINGLLSLSL